MTFKLRPEGWTGAFSAESGQERLQKARTAHARPCGRRDVTQSRKKAQWVGEEWWYAKVGKLGRSQVM